MLRLKNKEDKDHMLAEIISHATIPFRDELNHARHVAVFWWQQSKLPADVWEKDVLLQQLKRQQRKVKSLVEKAQSATLNNGALIRWGAVDAQGSRFEQLNQIRAILAPLWEESPESLHIICIGTERETLADWVAQVALINGAALPQRQSRKRDQCAGLAQVFIYGATINARASAVAQGNTLARTLTLLPPNELSPATYQTQLQALAQNYGWQWQAWDLPTLHHLGAGAFCAVTQADPSIGSGIVKLSYRHPAATQTVALVGKGVCFDTGGYHLKSARHMWQMHEDMNGSAVALGALVAATELHLPVNVDVWLALAENHLSPRAYLPNMVVRAINGKSIEIVHTDAEGRLLLADTLALAGRSKPNVLLSLATLTGSCVVALGSRYSGLFSNNASLAQALLSAGEASGERLCQFPLSADYDEALKSKIADLLHCTPDAEADHILAARFLSHFVAKRVWAHIDLSAHRHEGGLGAVGSDVTGFGVGLLVTFLEQMLCC